MKKLLLIILLFSGYILGQDIPIIGDTTDLKSHTRKQIVILSHFGGGDETGGGLFRRIDSTYAEGTNAFNYEGLDGLQWVRMQYMGGEMGDFTGLFADSLVVTKSSALTTGTDRRIQLNYTQTGASWTKIIEALRVNIDANVITGDWTNAIVARINYGASGNASGGMTAPFVSELSLMPGGMSGGAYYLLDLEVEAPASFTHHGNASYPSAYMNLAVWGNATAIGEWEANAHLFRTDGYTDATGNLWYDNTIRVHIEGTDWFLPMSTAEGTFTTAHPIVHSGGIAEGIDMQGAYTNAAIDLSDVTLNHTGSAGPVMIRAGSYGSPVTSSDPHQSGMIRLYGRNSALTDDGTGFYDRGVFVALKTTGAKGQMAFGGLVEVETTVSGDGPTNVKGAEFIVNLINTGSKLGNGVMYGAWCKITATDGATTHGSSKKAAIWLDNQMNGNNAGPGEEYTIFATTGGLRPDAFVGFETSSSGWDYMWYFDETAYDQAPISTMTPATGSQDADGSIIINLNGTAYYIPYYGIGKD